MRPQLLRGTDHDQCNPFTHRRVLPATRNNDRLRFAQPPRNCG
jgi:hypothetical protein